MTIRLTAATVVIFALGASMGTAHGLYTVRDQRVVPARDSVPVGLVAQGRHRRYLLHVPTTVAQMHPAPLVMVFHGGSDTPERTETMSRFSALAARERFIVAYPEGIDQSWADGRGSTPSEAMGIDDVAFARAVIADVGRRQAIDMKRIYATGPSNGGIFANRLGCDAADVFAAIGPVIAGMASRLVTQCRPSAAISVIGIQGVADPVVLFEGGEVGGHLRQAHGGTIEGSRRSQEHWRAVNGCAAAPAVTHLPVGINDGTSVTRYAYAGCRNGSGVVWYEIQGGGHRWPPSTAAVGERLIQRRLGISSKNIDATAVLWAFFKSHPKT